MDKANIFGRQAGQGYIWGRKWWRLGRI